MEDLAGFLRETNGREEEFGLSPGVLSAAIKPVILATLQTVHAVDTVLDMDTDGRSLGWSQEEIEMIKNIFIDIIHHDSMRFDRMFESPEEVGEYTDILGRLSGWIGIDAQNQLDELGAIYSEMVTAFDARADMEEDDYRFARRYDNDDAREERANIDRLFATDIPES